MHEMIEWLVQTVNEWGYIGIFLLMFLESTIFPVPSELVMIPAGYLGYKGEMNLILAFLAGTLGSLGGASLNYYIASRYGRNALLRWGKYIFVTPQKFEKFEMFFKEHGNLSTFNGRFIPGLRHFISFPAGLARMSKFWFGFYTTAGAGIWVAVLMGIGYYLGANFELAKEYATQAVIVALVFVVGITAVYIKLKRSKKTN